MDPEVKANSEKFTKNQVSYTSKFLQRHTYIRLKIFWGKSSKIFRSYARLKDLIVMPFPAKKARFTRTLGLSPLALNFTIEFSFVRPPSYKVNQILLI